MISRKLFSMAGPAALLALIPTMVLGQDYRARIQGHIADSSNASISGAKVNLLNTKTGVDSSRQTNETGNYLFDLVEPGTYSLSVEFPGFSRFLQENINVPSRADLTVNAVLAPRRGKRNHFSHRRGWRPAIQYG